MEEQNFVKLNYYQIMIFLLNREVYNNRLYYQK